RPDLRPTARSLSRNIGIPLFAGRFDQGIRCKTGNQRCQRQGAPTSSPAVGGAGQRRGHVMNARGMRRYIDDLLRGRRPKPFAPDDFKAAQTPTAIELRAAGLGAEGPSPEFLADLHQRLAEQMDEAPGETAPKLNSTRRQVIVGTSAAAA